MCEVEEQDRAHFEVFRNAEWQLHSHGPYMTASVTRACTEADLKARRGVHLNFRMEDFQDAVAERGCDAVMQEIGSLVLALLKTAVREEENDDRSQGVPAGGQTL